MNGVVVQPNGILNSAFVFLAFLRYSIAIMLLEVVIILLSIVSNSQVLNGK